MGKRLDRFFGSQVEEAGAGPAGRQEELLNLWRGGLTAAAADQSHAVESAGRTLGGSGGLTSGTGTGWGRKMRTAFLILTVVLLVLTGAGKLAGVAHVARLGGPVADPPDPVLPFLRTSRLVALATAGGIVAVLAAPAGKMLREGKTALMR